MPTVFRKALKIDPKDAETLYCFVSTWIPTTSPKITKDIRVGAGVGQTTPMVWTGLANAQRSMGEFDGS